MARLWIFCYDIADDRRRRQTEQTLLNYGERIQESVFELFLAAPAAAALARNLRARLDPAHDSLRAYPFCAHCQDAVRIVGHGRRASDPSFYIF